MNNLRINKPEYRSNLWNYFEPTKCLLKLSLCLPKHHAMKTYWGWRGIAPHILDLGTILRWVLSFTTRPLYPRGKRPRYPLDGRGGAGWAPEPVWTRWWRENFPAPAGNGTREPRPDRPARSRSLYRLSYTGSYKMPSIEYSNLVRRTLRSI
jgi:hypothetical protein